MGASRTVGLRSGRRRDQEALIAPSAPTANRCMRAPTRPRPLRSRPPPPSEVTWNQVKKATGFDIDHLAFPVPTSPIHVLPAGCHREPRPTSAESAEATRRPSNRQGKTSRKGRPAFASGRLPANLRRAAVTESAARWRSVEAGNPGRILADRAATGRLDSKLIRQRNRTSLLQVLRLAIRVSPGTPALRFLNEGLELPDSWWPAAGSWSPYR